MRSLALAVAFLTRVPVDGGASSLRAAAWWFPLVGALVGGVIGGVRALAGTVLDPLPAIVLALAAGVLFTGALHEDGFADVADALGVHADPARRREILKDPRNGTFGTLALVFGALFALAALAGDDAGDVLRAAVLAHVVGRWTLLAHAWLFGGPGDGEPGLGAALEVEAPLVGFSTLWVAVLAVVVGGLGPGLLTLALAAALTLVGGAALRRAFGGLRGDSLGAVLTLAVLGGYAVLG